MKLNLQKLLMIRRVIDVDNLEEKFGNGYKFPNGLPLSDELKETIDKFYEYAKAQGDTRSREEIYAQVGEMVMNAMSSMK